VSDAYACVRVGVGARARVFAFARVVLHIQHATRIRHIVCSSSLSHIFRRYLTNDMIFGKTLGNIICVF
jgi:hypothetical protein